MDNTYERHPLATLAGLLALAVWAIYIVLTLMSIPDVPYRMMINSVCGLLVCAAVIANLRYWRAVVLLACGVYVIVYVVQLARMTGLMAGGDSASIFSALAFYYSASWTVATGVFLERGVLGGLMHGYLEYAMPLLVLALIAVTLASRRPKLTASYSR
ncbi:MAG TPA: hypothetical protein VFZ14_16295 [Burkholderiales bacterium]|nr:hypothetical protein [Burkholderiales bacterium]